MPNWKKVIVSGSNAILNSLNVTNGITGSLLGTSSYATQALTASNANTASYVNQLNQSVVISGSLTVSGSTNLVGTTGTTLLSTNADTLTFTGSIFTSGSIVSTGSLNITSVTSSLLGTASYATQALTASYIVLAQTASYVLNAVSSSYALTASNVQGGTQFYIPLWNTNTSLTNSYLNQSGSVLKTIYSGQDRGLTLDYNTNSFVLGNAGVGNNTYLQVYDGGSVINIYTPNYTYFNDKVGVRIIPTNPGLAVSGSLEVTGPGTTKFINTNVEITGALSVTGGITGSLLGTASYATQALTASYSQTASYVNPLIQTVQLTGSLNVTGSTTQIGNNTLNGNTTLTGSIIISGSTTSPTTPTIQVYGDMETNGVIKFTPVTKNINNSISASYIYVSGSTNDLYFAQNGSGYSNNTRLRWLESILYTGILNGGIITSTPGSTTFNISSGSGIIVAQNASTGSAPYPTVQYVNWGDINNIPITNSGSAKLTYVGLDSTGTPVQQVVPWGSTDINQFDTQINLGVVLHLSGSVSTGVFSAPQIAYGPQQRQDDFFRAFGPLKISGHTLQASGSTLGIVKTGGTAYKEGANYRFNPSHPSTTVENDVLTSKIYRYYISGSTPIIDTGVGNAGYTAIDPTQHVNTATGALTSVATNKYSIQRVFWVPNSPTNAFIVYYGNGEYNSLTDAAANINTEPFTEAPNTAANAIFVGWIIVSGGASSLTNANDATILQGGIFRNVGGIGSSGTSPLANTLAGLSDVSIPTKTLGDLLYYNGSQWINSKILSGSYTLTGSLTTNNNITAVSVTATSFTGSLQGTASYAVQALSASYALNASTASYFNGTSLTISQSLTINQNTASLASGTQTISTNSTGSYTSAFYKYTLASGSNARAGQVMAVWNGASIQYTDVATNDIGTTSNVALTASLSNGNVLLTSTLPSSGWTVKTLVNLL